MQAHQYSSSIARLALDLGLTACIGNDLGVTWFWVSRSQIMVRVTVMVTVTVRVQQIGVGSNSTSVF